MIVKLKYMGVMDIDLPSEIGIEEDMVVRDLLRSVLRFEESSLEGMTYLVNKKKASLETKLQEGDEILILQVLGGG